MRVKINIKKIKIGKLKEFLGKLPLVLAQHSFLTCLFLFFSALIFGGFLFYKYSFLAQKVEPELLSTFLLKEKIYQDVLESWQRQEEKFNEADFKEYPNLFKEAVVFLEEGEESAPEESEELTPLEVLDEK